MIYVCADDYGLCHSISSRIQTCIDEGALNSVSVFPNFDKVDLTQITKNKDVRLCLHLNLVEGKCMANAEEVDLIADAKGNLKHTFGGLFKLNLFHPKKLEAQAYKEIQAQVMFWKSILPDGEPFCINSHQHTHMIPAIFRALINVINDEKIPLLDMRIPIEPILPYVQAPELCFTYSPLNIIKRWLLKFLWLINKNYSNARSLPTSHFMGILFSGSMDAKKVLKILPKYKNLAEKTGKDIEVLFHPGYMDENEFDLKSKNVVFEKFYLSPNRQTEFNSVLNIPERSVQ